jgi:hypothetical protein
VSTYTFDVTAFRLAFPAFADVTAFPTATLQMNWDTAGCYIENTDSGCFALEGACRVRALNLMTAHLTALSVLVAAGNTPGLVQSATVDKVTVSLTPPPLPNQWQWWLSLTPYGQQLLALLQVSSAGGFYYGGLPEGLAIRKFGGIF